MGCERIRFLNQDQAVLDLISGQQPLYCLGRTKAGHPRHPLYVKNSVDKELFSGEPNQSGFVLPKERSLFPH